MPREALLLVRPATPPSHADSCRLNVALTRAKHNLLVVGCAPALQQSAPAFASLLARCRSTPGAYFQGRLPQPAAFAAQATCRQAPMLLEPAQQLQSVQQAQQAPQQQGLQSEQALPSAGGHRQQRWQQAPAAAVTVRQQVTADVMDGSWSWSEEGDGSDAEDMPLSKRQQQLQRQQTAGVSSRDEEQAAVGARLADAAPAGPSGRQSEAEGTAVGAGEEQPGSAPS